METDKYRIHRIKFSLALVLQIPSVILSIFIFAFFITHPNILQNLQRKALLILLIINFLQLSLNLPMAMHFFHLNRVSPATGAYCRWWMFVESTLDAASAFLVATISIQRHILVFHSTILRIRSKRYILYYLPLIICVIYSIIFYMAAVIFYPCDETQWNFTANLCGDTICYLAHNQILATFDWIVNTGLPIIIIMLANIALVMKVIGQKYRRQQTVTWSKQRRMTLQLLSISSLYLIAWSPTIVIGLLLQLSSSVFLSRIQDDYVSDLSYIICLLLPWVCLGQIPELNKWFWKQFRHFKQSSLNSVRPG